MQQLLADTAVAGTVSDVPCKFQLKLDLSSSQVAVNSAPTAWQIKYNRYLLFVLSAAVQCAALTLVLVR